MQLTVNIRAYDTIKLPDTFQPSVIETNKALSEKERKNVNVYFGERMSIVVCVARNQKLSDDDRRRISILVSGKE